MWLVPRSGEIYPEAMSVTDILHEIEALPAEERLRLVGKLIQLTEADVPESLRQSMAEAARGELVDMDDAPRELD